MSHIDEVHYLKHIDFEIIYRCIFINIFIFRKEFEMLKNVIAAILIKIYLSDTF